MICPVLDLVQRPGKVEPIQDEDLANLACRYPGPIGGKAADAIHDVLEAKQRYERFQEKDVSDDLRLIPHEDARRIRVESSMMLRLGVLECHVDQPLASVWGLCST